MAEVLKFPTKTPETEEEFPTLKLVTMFFPHDHPKIEPADVGFPMCLVQSDVRSDNRKELAEAHSDHMKMMLAWMHDVPDR